MKLIDSEIKAAKPKDKPYKLSDGDGLVLLIQPNGSKYWRYRYRFGGSEKMLSIGTYPKITLRDARQLRNNARDLLKQGIDPSKHRQEEKQRKAIAAENSFESIARLWFEHWKSTKVEAHTKQIQAMLDRYVFPVIGKIPINEVTSLKLIETFKKIESNNASSIARRAHGTCGQIMRYAVSHGLVARNPVADFQPSDVLKPREKKHFARLSEAELPGLLKKIDVYHGQPLTRWALQLMTLTFVRNSELTGARWIDIDFDSRLWRVPLEDMKMKLPYIVPLSDQAIVILKKIKEFTGGQDLIFPSQRGDGGTMGASTLLKAIGRMGFGGRMTVHGFRGIASTILHERGFNHDHIELQLSHTQHDAVSAAYNHATYLEPRAKMIQVWADFLDELRKKIISCDGKF